MRVNVFRRRAFSIDVQYRKLLHDPASDRHGVAATWGTGGTGTHSGDATYIRGMVAEYVDEFLAEYLRVNESACGGPGREP